MRLYEMKRSVLIVTALALLGSVVAGCKTTEKNYRDAYEMARARTEENGGIDSTIYSRFRPQGKGSTVAVGNDSLTFTTVTIGYTENCGATPETLGRYDVVVAQFKQIFNAKAMRSRLIDNGYENAMIVHTREPLYYVIAVPCATPAEALEALRRVESDSRLSLRQPFPWVLRPAHLVR